MSNQKKLDCLLINPYFVFPDGFYVKQRTLDPPLGLLALASFIREGGFTVEILDLNYEEADSNEEILDLYHRKFENRYDEIGFVGLTTTTTTIYSSFRVSKIFKEKYPNTKVIFGGAHASFVPDETLDKEFVDAVCIGEGEDTLLEFVQGVPNEDIAGLAYAKIVDGEKVFIKNKPRVRKRKLDELPIPAYDLLEIEEYRPIIGNFKRLPAMMMITSRGCPWDCNFCRRPVGKMWTYRSAESLYNEMKYLSEEFGIKDIAFMDDVFTVNKHRVDRLCNLLIEKPLDIKWKCFARVDIVNPDMLKKMHQAGCWGIMYGIENFDQKVLDDMSKGVETPRFYEAVRWSKEASLEVRVCMMVGNVGDTPAILEKNIDMLIELDPDYIALAILTPFPGHDIYNWGIERDLIMSYNWDDYYGSTPLLKLDTLTPEETRYYFRKMAFKFYFRPKFIFKKLISLNSFQELKINFFGFLGLFSFFIEKFKRMFKKNNEPKVSNNEEYIANINVDKIKQLTITPTEQTSIT